MPLARLRIKALRCLTELELELGPERNVIYGPNGAGKTSILEGIFLLGRGRSFRTRQIRKLVRRGEEGFSVYGEVLLGDRRRRLGVAYVEGHLDKRIDGEPAGGTAALAELLPVHVIDPGLHDLIQGGPSERRRFLDWGVFHVEPNYLPAWKRYRRHLSQRNAGLKGAIPPAELGAWTQGLIEAGEVVHEARKAYVRSLEKLVAGHGRTLLDRTLTVEYLQGWRADLPLQQAVAASESRDRFVGATEVGPHRADLAVRLDGVRVSEEASRGQQKLAAAALILAQAELHARTQSDRGLLLVDDPAAELDERSLDRLMLALEQVPTQRVVTALSPRHLPAPPGFPVFHVEHGALRAV